MHVLPGVEAHPHTDIVAASDLRHGALEAFAQRYRARAYGTIEELCADPDVDVIWVATPNQFHARHCILAAEHAKHVICTKPMAVTLDEYAAMCAAAERNNVQLLCGQTFSMHPNIRAMRDVIASGELGRLIAVNTWLSTDWLLKPRDPEELDEALGGGVLYRHGPHLVDTVRLLAGGEVRSVRARVGRWMRERPCAGNFSAFLDFEDGTPATISYNGYGYFDTSELTWGFGSRMYTDEQRVEVRKSLGDTHVNDAAKEHIRFGAGIGDRTRLAARYMSWFGLTVANCERGDIRQSPAGIFIYDAGGRREVTGSEGQTGLLEMEELYSFLTEGTPVKHDGAWGLATLEVCLAIAASSVERSEVMLRHQTAVANRGRIT
jgi:phthalate 4,5-cis-dihydrodiol dehydrogenase